MKVLHVISSIDRRGGGPSEGVRQLGKVLTTLGHQVEVVCLDSPGSVWISDFPLTVYALGPGMSPYQFSRSLVPWLKQNAPNYDSIIINGLWQFHGFGTWQALRWLKKKGFVCPPYFVFTHGMLDPWFKQTYPLKHLKKWLYWPWAEYRVLRDAQAVIFTCEEERRLARQSFWLYRCNEAVVTYGTATPHGNAEKMKTVFLTQYPELQDKRIFLFMSRIHPKKGCDLLIEAFSRIANADPNLHLVIAGPDQTGWQTALKKLIQRLEIEDRVTWTGMLSGDLKYGAFYAADVFVLPSHQENFGIVVAESLASGTPVLISNKVNIWREIEGCGAGLVEEDTLQGVIKNFEHWLSLPSKAQDKMRQNSIQCFENKFEIKQAAQSLIDILSKT